MLTPEFKLQTADPQYRRFRAELRKSTNLVPIEVAEWIAAKGKLLVLRFMASGESDGASMHDYQAWLREEYARERGLIR